jgi:hypothetical protein
MGQYFEQIEREAIDRPRMNSLQILLFSYSKINGLSAYMENTHNGKKRRKTEQVGIAPACYGSSLGSNPDIHLSKIQNGRHKHRSGPDTLDRQKKTIRPLKPKS